MVGGGLAGLTAALGLLKLGLKVNLFESADPLGGEAGVSNIDGRYEEHGYHIFPPWYVNTCASH